MQLIQLILNKRWDESIQRALSHQNETRTWASVPLPELKEIHNLKQSKILPLHAAILQGGPFKLVELLIQQNPAALRKKDSIYHRYPLHMACLYSPTTNVVSLITDEYPEALVVRDRFIRTPLHYASYGQASADVFKILTKKYPRASKSGDIQGWTPLHIAIATGCEYEVIKSLVEIDPQALTRKTKNGATSRQIVENFHGSGSEMMKQLQALQTALDAMYDMEGGHISLGSVADALREQKVIKSLYNHNRHEMCENSCVKHDYNIEQHVSEETQNTDNKFPLTANNECIICIQETRTHAFVPCGHMCICQTCAQRPEMYNKKKEILCPVCRKKSFIIMKVFT